MGRPRRDRRSPRWRLHDDRRAGLYFVTACTAARRPVFGAVAGAVVVPTPLGRVAADEWARTLARRPALLPDVFVVMPNHVHLLFGIVEATDGGPVDRGGPDDRRDTMHGVPTRGVLPGGWTPRRFGQHLAGSVSSVVQAYKAAVTRRARRDGLWPDGPLWQGRFHDRVVRTDGEADRIRRYIAENPARWAADRLHPDRPPPWRGR